MQFYEAISGGRIHSGYLRTGAISHYIPNLVVEEVILLCTDVPVKLQEIHNIITNIHPKATVLILREGSSS